MLLKRCVLFTFGLMIIFSISILLTYHSTGNDRNVCYRLSRLRSAFNQSINSGSPRLCVIVRVHDPQIEYLPVLVLSLYYASLENDRIFIINTDNRTDIRFIIQTIQFLNNLVARPNYVTLLDLGIHSFSNDYGYGMTDRALSYLYDNYMQPAFSCHYITFTNGDNFYSRSFGQKLLPHMKDGKDIIAWGFISHHYWPEFQEMLNPQNKVIPPVYDDGSNKCINVSLQISRVDLGAVAFRLGFLQKHKLYFRHSDGTYKYTSDGLFIRKAATLTNASILLRQTLFVHQ